MTAVNTPLESYKAHLIKIAGMHDETWEVLKDVLNVVAVDKGEHILEEGKVCNHIYFLHEGSFRSYYNKDGEESTTGIFLSGMCFTNMKSIRTLEPSHLSIQALEPGTIVQLRKQDMLDLYKKAPALESVGRIMLESMLIAENEWKEMYTIYNAEERYSFLLNKYPHYIQQIPLQYIASFLGIRRETLSRIRGRNNRKTF